MLHLCIKRDTTRPTLLGGNQDHPISSTCPIESRCRSILQDGERLYISHIEATEQRGIGDPINDIERGGP